MNIQVINVKGVGEVHCHTDKHVGMTMGKTIISEHRNDYGQHWFEATEQIGTIFGAEVEGEIKGIGATEEIARQRLATEREKLNESLWA